MPPATAIAPSALDPVLVESAPFSRFETTEPALAVRETTGIYGPHSLSLEGKGRFDMKMRSFELAQLHVAQIRYGSQVLTSMDGAHPFWVFSFLRAGTTSLRRGRGADEFFGSGEAGVNSPDSVADLVLSPDMELVNLRVPAADMVAACTSLLGAEHAAQLRFDDRAAPQSAPVHLLTRVIGHLAGAARHSHPAARRYEDGLRDAALFELLLGWPNTAARASAQADAALPESTRRARDYIHAHAAEVPTVAQIARAAGVGVRALGLGFEKHFGVAPLRYLQQVRLDGVRAQLCAAGRADTITSIALDWGFTNPGAFAARYRERFGESPRDTLRRRAH